MKKFKYVFLLLILLPWQTFAQDESKIKPYDLNLEVGVYYKFFDYLGGFGFNFVVYSPDKALSFALRNTAILSIEKAPTKDGVYTDYFVIGRFNTLNYLDVDYCWNLDKKHRVETGIGFGWIYLGKREDFKLNRQYGYSVLSISANYKVTWFNFEIRGDIPLIKTVDENGFGEPTLFPVTLGMFYRFKPGKE